MNKKYQVGDKVRGIVTGIQDYGIFLSFDNDYTGMIHISEISENFVTSISIFANINDVIPCTVLEVDETNKKLRCIMKNTPFVATKEANMYHGFSLLKKQLPVWMDEKLKEYSQNK